MLPSHRNKKAGLASFILWQFGLSHNNVQIMP
jgi:hypothetical protein